MTVVDTSVVVAAITASDSVVLSRCRAALDASSAPVAHVLIESFSVLTRLPPPWRLRPDAAHAFLSSAFPDPPIALSSRGYWFVIGTMAGEESAGGKVYDAVVARTAFEAGQVLLTRDVRAAQTYGLMEAEFVLL